MAAPQQQALTNTSCTFPASPAVFASSESYGGGQPVSCGDLHDRVSGISNCDIQSVVHSSAAVVSPPVLGHTASRKTKPCSLCGTAAQRSQSSLIPHSPISPQEQPVVLLHRLEDGLPEGDVDSLRAFGTIRLLPVHRDCDNSESATDVSKHDCDRKYQCVETHSMSPGSLLYKSIKRGTIKKRTELAAGIHSQRDLSGSVTKEVQQNYIDSDDYYAYNDITDEKTENCSRSVTNIANAETDKGTHSHRVNTKAETVVHENSVGNKLNRSREVIGAHVKAAKHSPPASPASQPSYRFSSAHQQIHSSSQADSLSHSATTRSPVTPNNSPSPQRSISPTTSIHSHPTTPHSPSDTHHSLTPSSPSTPMSVVCSPVVQLPSATLSSPSQNISSPSAISPPESPPSPPTPFSPPRMGSPVASDRETVYATCSVDAQSSSPYSPRTLPSLPASPTSLPSSSASPPSPAPSLESPPVSPVVSSDCQSEISHYPPQSSYVERLEGDSSSDTSGCEAELDTSQQTKVTVEDRKDRDHKPAFQSHLPEVSSMENAAVSNRNTTEQHLVTQIASASHTNRTALYNTCELDGAAAVSQNSNTKTQVDSFSEISSVCPGEDEETMVAANHLNPDLSQCLLSNECVITDSENDISDYKSSLVKLVFKVKQRGGQQPQIASEKKDSNKESGIPKIVLTLTGKGPNKEYSCSNRIRHDSENCSDNLNNKKHKAKKNKRQKPKDREKVKKLVKGDKHKRHRELFGEDSNDSCDDLNADSSSDQPSERRDSRTPSLEEKEIPQPTKSLSQGEPCLLDANRDFPPSLPESEPPLGGNKEEEHTRILVEDSKKIQEPSVGVGSEALSHSLSEVISNNLEANGTVENGVKNHPSVEKSRETLEGQVESFENNVEESFSEEDEAPEPDASELPCSESENTEARSTSQLSMVHSNEISHPSKQSDGFTLRSRKSRHAKNTGSGRNSDACLWVSFGMNAPLPLPAADVPSLKRIFTSKERAKLKECVSAENKGYLLPDESSVSVTEKCVSKASHKDHKEREKTETLSEDTKEYKDKNAGEKTKPSRAEYDHNHELSDSHHRSHSSSSHGGRSHVRSRVRSKDDSTHHRHRHSHKRSRKSEESREKITKKEASSSHQNSWKPTSRDEPYSREISNISHEEKSPVVNAQEHSAEQLLTTTPPQPKVSPSPGDGSRVPKDLIVTLPQSVENIPNKETNNTALSNAFNTEESSDNHYYRPKKIRKINHTSTTRDHWNENKTMQPTEEVKTQESKTEDSAPSSYKNNNSLNSSLETAGIPLKQHDPEQEAVTTNSDASMIETEGNWKPHDETTNTEKQPQSPRDNESTHEHRKRKERSPSPPVKEPVARTEEPNEQIQSPAAIEKEEAAGKQDDPAGDSIPENEESEKYETEKKEKERRRRSRKDKRRENSGAGGRCSVLQEVQHRREVAHEEERGRRLAQEIKGFNWLEQKIKNGSLLSSGSAPSTPTTSPATKETESTSRTQSTPNATPSTHLTIATKEEGLARKKLLSSNSSGIGLKGHLQTAVPPLIPSSKVTALPKRRPSLGTPTTPPCSTPSALSSVTSVPSMTVPGAVYTQEPTSNRSEHGRVGAASGKSNTGSEHEHTGQDKATLYSSTTSSKATLYGVKDNSYHTFYDAVSVCSENYYGGVSSGSLDSQYSITTSPTISFYGSAKHQEANLNSENYSSTGSRLYSSVISSPSSSSTLKDQQHNSLHSPKSNAFPSKDSDWNLNLSNNTKSSGSSANPHSTQRFSHKQTLLRRAFQEMLKSETTTEQPKENQNFAETEMKKAEVSKCMEAEAVGFSSNQSSSRSTSPADNTSATSCNDSPSPNPSAKSIETNYVSVLSHSQEHVIPSVKFEKDLVGPAHGKGKILSNATETKEATENVTEKLDPDNLEETKNPKQYPDDEGRNDSSCEIQNIVSDTEKVIIPNDSKDLQASIIESIVSSSGIINVKVLKDDIIPKTDDESKEDAEVQPTLLLSALYKELLKTRQEVEKLRKVQELMLTEKGEKKEDISEDSTDKTESDRIDENANRSERISEKRKEKDDSHHTELATDDDFQHENKKSKISIRSDLLTEDSMVIDTISSNISTPQKDIPQPQQAASPALASPSVMQSESEVPVITLESSAIPEASHLSRVSPVITAASPALSNSISGPPNITSPSPRSHARTSPGMASPVVSRTSPGTPKSSPAPPRTSPGMPMSGITSPGIPISPGLPGSPGIQKSSPGIPRSSPGVLQLSPGLARASSGIPRASPGTVISPGTSGLGSIKNGAEVISMSPGVPPMIPASVPSSVFNTPTILSSTDNLQISLTHPAPVPAQSKVTTVHSIASPVAPIHGFHQSPVTCNAVSIISPPGVRASHHTSKVEMITSKADTSLTNMSPTKLRSVFGISSSEVELMPISTSGAKYSLHEAQSQAFSKAVENAHHHISEAPLLMNAVRGIHRESSSKEVESSTSCGPRPFHNLPCPEDPRMALKTHQYESGAKRHAFSTSDLPDHPGSVCKQPPPLKPVPALLRRHSDNLDIHAVMHHQAMYPGTHKSLASAAELKNANSMHPYSQSSQYLMSGPSRRRNSDSNSSERSQEYQQSLAMGMQHPYPHMAPGASVMRSLGSDKATIFPIPQAMPPGIRPFKPTTPPSVSRAQREHYQNENFYRSNFSFFERIREKFANSSDGGVSAMERFQSSAVNAEKPVQPQTFAPRVLVRESVPDASSHVPTTTFSALNFPNPNQAMPNIMPNHQNHYPGNIHHGSTIHHMAQTRMHPAANQVLPNVQRNATGSGGEKLCFRCSQPARFVCSGCKKAWYCSEHCQREDWSSHGAACVL